MELIPLQLAVYMSDKSYMQPDAGIYLGSCQSFLPKIYGGLVQVSPHLVLLNDAVAVEDETNFVEGYVIVLEHHADALVHI